MWLSNLHIPAFPISRELTYREGRSLSAGIRCRDPFILRAGDKYYLYESAGGFGNEGGEGVYCSVSDDLETWSDRMLVYRAPEDFHGEKDFFWAPECHYYKGKFYIFTSVFSKDTNHRAISAYRADNPLGPFVDVAGGHLSPREWDAIDGTLYVDKEGQPWLVFVHEWVCMPEGNGSMVAAKLSDDFTHLASEPQHLFFARELPNATMGVTDGPYLFRADGGKLVMTWSNFVDGKYVTTVATSESGDLFGPWKQADVPLYRKGVLKGWDYDGGHGMIFPKKEGGYALALHSPNSDPETYEHIKILPVALTDEGITLS